MSTDKSGHLKPRSTKKWLDKLYWGNVGFKQKRKSVVDEVALFDDEQIEQRLEGDEARQPLQIVTPAKPHGQVEPPEQPLPQPVVPPEARSQRPRTEEVNRQAANFENARSVAIEGYEISNAEESKAGIPITKRFRQWAGHLSNLQKALIGGIVLLIAGGVGTLIYLLTPPALALPVGLGDEILRDPFAPIPSWIILPDGETFELAKGYLVNAQWTPQGPEWLAGSEVPRWLALPWNKKLEKAIRAFKSNDPIKMKMSNGDMLAYRYQGLQEVAVQDMDTFHTNSAELLIVLSKPRGETRLIVVAIP